MDPWEAPVRDCNCLLLKIACFSAPLFLKAVGLWHFDSFSFQHQGLNQGFCTCRVPCRSELYLQPLPFMLQLLPSCTRFGWQANVVQGLAQSHPPCCLSFPLQLDSWLTVRSQEGAVAHPYKPLWQQMVLTLTWLYDSSIKYWLVLVCELGADMQRSCVLSKHSYEIHITRWCKHLRFFFWAIFATGQSRNFLLTVINV